MGFPHMELIDSEGYSGGIWCLWESCISHVVVLERHHQYMHLQITDASNHSWMFTVVYASPSIVSRRALWSNLSRIASTTQDPWLIGGDLNGTMLHRERRSSATFRCSYDRDLLRWVDMHDLRDVGFVGPEFTWKRGTSEARYFVLALFSSDNSLCARLDDNTVKEAGICHAFKIWDLVSLCFESGFQVMINSGLWVACPELNFSVVLEYMVLGMVALVVGFLLVFDVMILFDPASVIPLTLIVETYKLMTQMKL
ncbi:hypothetical protein K1719_001739 [Acacia pycnantha]|nr:hypothetical protein K1719_001739 [Acacia pycnantha]